MKFPGGNCQNLQGAETGRRANGGGGPRAWPAHGHLGPGSLAEGVSSHTQGELGASKRGAHTTHVCTCHSMCAACACRPCTHACKHVYLHVCLLCVRAYTLLSGWGPLFRPTSIPPGGSHGCWLHGRRSTDKCATWRVPPGPCSSGHVRPFHSPSRSLPAHTQGGSRLQGPGQQSSPASK